MILGPISLSPLSLSLCDFQWTFLAIGNTFWDLPFYFKQLLNLLGKDLSFNLLKNTQHKYSMNDMNAKFYFFLFFGVIIMLSLIYIYVHIINGWVIFTPFTYYRFAFGKWSWLLLNFFPPNFFFFFLATLDS